MYIAIKERIYKDGNHYITVRGDNAQEDAKQIAMILNVYNRRDVMYEANTNEVYLNDNIYLVIVSDDTTPKEDYETAAFIALCLNQRESEK